MCGLALILGATLFPYDFSFEEHPSFNLRAILLGGVFGSGCVLITHNSVYFKTAVPSDFFLALER
jgi:hypothetical protein